MADVVALRSAQGRRYREALAAPTPLAGAFLHYLSTRADLLRATDCVDLATVQGRIPASPWPVVRASLTRELGRPPEKVFGYFETRPIDVGSLFQWHSARLEDGRPVVVKLVRPEVREALPASTEALGEVARDLEAAGLDRAALGSGLVDFQHILARELDLGRELAELDRASQVGAGAGRLKVPYQHRSLSSRFVLTRERLAGSTLEELVALEAESGDREGARRVRRLCRLWLSLALVEGLFPCDPQGPDMLFLADGKVSFASAWTSLPPGSRTDLLEYLSAVAAGDLDRAADAALRTLPAGSAEAEDSLRWRIRHSEPFRDAAWDFAGERFVKLVLLHWKEARNLGLRPGPAVEDFYRGLFVLTRRSRLVDPDGEPFLDGLLKLRFSETVGELSGLAERGALEELATRQLPMLLSLPQRLDRALSVATRDRVGLDQRRRGKREERSPTNSWAAVSAILLVLVAVVATVHHLGAGSGWADRLGAGLVLSLGALALFITGRRA